MSNGEFDEGYVFDADDVPNLDLLHEMAGLGAEWVASDKRQALLDGAEVTGDGE